MGDNGAVGNAQGSLRHYLAPWYLAYLILGLITSRMLPFLLPLMVASTTHDLGHIAYVIGAYNAGLLPAPLLGLLAERFSSSARCSSAVLAHCPSDWALSQGLWLPAAGSFWQLCGVLAPARLLPSPPCSCSISHRNPNGTRASDGSRVSTVPVSWADS